jgi:hypothetical protein
MPRQLRAVDTGTRCILWLLAESATNVEEANARRAGSETPARETCGGPDVAEREGLRRPLYSAAASAESLISRVLLGKRTGTGGARRDILRVMTVRSPSARRASRGTATVRTAAATAGVKANRRYPLRQTTTPMSVEGGVAGAHCP